MSGNDYEWSSVNEGTHEPQLEKVQHDEVPRALSPEHEKRLWRKVDLRLLPILSVMYLLSFMDRGRSYKLSCMFPN